jgi:hypothetical protein
VLQILTAFQKMEFFKIILQKNMSDQKCFLIFFSSIQNLVAAKETFVKQLQHSEKHVKKSQVIYSTRWVFFVFFVFGVFFSCSLFPASAELSFITQRLK